MEILFIGQDCSLKYLCFVRNNIDDLYMKDHLMNVDYLLIFDILIKISNLSK